MSDTVYNLLLHAHSIGRWLLLLVLVVAIFNSMIAGERPFIRSDARTGLILTIIADLMLLIGLGLWYFGPKGYTFIQTQGFSGAMKDATSRFFAIEHLTGMVIAIILMHIGKAQGKKKISDRKKHIRTLVFYLIALVIILATIPWPFREIGASSHWY